jgi:L-seryl-tRNA(Ser) seleniumtransferase
MNTLLRSAVARRELFRFGGLMAGVVATANRAAAAAADVAGSIYRAIGVQPVLNAKGTFTIITGSQTLPEVKRAMDQASRSYVQMDELMDGVSKRLAELTGAEWGIVTAGCCAAITHMTSACIAGSNPERMQRLPNLTGLKNEVIIPAYSRNVYDHAIRMLGTTIVEVDDIGKIEAAFSPRTAMVYILGGPGDEGPLGTAAISAVAKRHNVPLLVDAAAEILTFPNVHLQRGATAVAYSGGKCIRGPQAAGLLLGEKSLLQAAWLNSAPHHAFGRSLKVGKEEIMGMLAAVEAWKTRDHEAEWKLWLSWLNHIGSRVSAINGITTSVVQPEGLSNRTPSLRIQWDGARLGITGSEAAKVLLDTEPRIVVAGGTGTRPDRMASTVTITPYMMIPGDEKVVADRLFAVLSKPPHFDEPKPPQGEPASLQGQWDLRISFIRGAADHDLTFEQQGSSLVGTHRGEFVSGDLSGSVEGSDVRFRSSQKIEGTRLSYDFTGRVAGGSMSGTVNLGEYGDAQWTAQRHTYRAPGGIVRPVKSV